MADLVSADLADLTGAGLELSISGSVATVTLARPGAPQRDDARACGAASRVSAPRSRTTSGWSSSAAPGRRFAPASTCACSAPEGVPGEDRNPERGRSRLSTSPSPASRPATSGCATRHSCRSRRCKGHAIGGGFQLALSCDLRVLADDAKLCMKEPALGLVPDLTGTKPLVDIVGLPRAIELCLTARTVGAHEAAAAAAGRARRARGRAGRRGRATWSPRCCPPTPPRRARPRRCCRRRRATPWSSRRRPSVPPRPRCWRPRARDQPR